jgi:hypothetical protein
MDILIDWEYEYNKDYIYALERQKDIENSWREFEERQPAKIIINEIKPRSRTFYRATKKILQLRSHLFTKTNSRTIRHNTNMFR